MKESKPFVAHRWVEIISRDAAFSMLELDRMPEYGFTGATLWTSFESFDTYFYTLPVVYRGAHADLNTARDAQRVRHGAEFLREFSRRAHHHGMQVMHAYHMCNFVAPAIALGGPDRYTPTAEALQKLRPNWFNAHGEIDFSRDEFYEFMSAEVETFFDTFPHVDGLFCWNCECSCFTPTRLKHQSVSKAQIAARAMRTVYDVCRRRGKIMTHDIHTAGADKELTEGIIRAAGECPDLILGADATYSDWHLHLDTTPWLAQMSRNNRIYVAFDGAGEFFGQGRTIAGWPNWITKHFNEARKHSLTAVSIRNNVSTKETSCVLVPMLEFNLRLVSQLAREGSADIKAMIQSWWRRHFSGTLPPGMDDVFLSFEQIIGKALYINGTNITEYYPDHSFSPKALLDVPGFPCWHSEQFTPSGTPIPEIMAVMMPSWAQRARSVEELRQEKRDAIAQCDEALRRLEAMPMAPEDRDYFTARVSQMRDLATAFLHAINVVHPLYQVMVEHHDRSLADPRTALREQRAELLKFADVVEQRWGPEFYRKLAEKMRLFAADIPAKYYA